MKLFINGKSLTVTSSQSIGKGGEADVYDIGGGKVLKLFKREDHPDLAGLPHEKLGARLRIEEHQKKLPQFPRSLPKGVIAPSDLVQEKSGRVVGYTMPLVKDGTLLARYGEKSFRMQGVSDESVVDIFGKLYSLVSGIHNKQVVIGDFNDLNVLVSGTDPYIIDADSFQFGPFPCRVFTEKFADPVLLRTKTKEEKRKHPIGNLILDAPFSSASDWYAYVIMLMQSLLFVGPYGGVHRPVNGKRIPHEERALHRLTIFSDEVRYPKPTRHWSILPDNLLSHFSEVFEKDVRGVFPQNLIEEVEWTTCSVCGLVHARSVCPACTQYDPSIVVERVTGKVKLSKVFETSGTIVYATYQGRLRWLYHKDGVYMREGRQEVVTGDLDPHIRFRIRGDDTIFGKGTGMFIFSKDSGTQKVSTESYGQLSMFDSNRESVFWIDRGVLKRSGALGITYPQTIGSVLSNRTIFWSGDSYGFGFYQAGTLQRAFVFSTQHRGINDTVDIPLLRGHVLDATGYFSKDKIWFFVSVEESGKRINRAHLIRTDGSVEALFEAEVGDGSWIESIRGHCALSDFLLVATDDGIVRVESQGSTLAVVKEFPDTAEIVDSSSQLFPGDSGIAVVGKRNIWNVRLT